MSKTLTFTVGCPGSGKSTYADKHYGHALRLERDRFREALFGDRRAYHRMCADSNTAQQLSLLVGSTMHHALRIGIGPRGFYKEAIISDTGVAWAAVRRFHQLARLMNMKIEVVYFDVPYHILAERNLTRPEEHFVPAAVLDRFFRMQKGLPLGDEVNELWWEDKNKVDRLIRVNEKGEVL